MNVLHTSVLSIALLTELSAAFSSSTLAPFQWRLLTTNVCERGNRVSCLHTLALRAGPSASASGKGGTGKQSLAKGNNGAVAPKKSGGGSEEKFAKEGAAASLPVNIEDQLFAAFGDLSKPLDAYLKPTAEEPPERTNSKGKGGGQKDSEVEEGKRGGVGTPAVEKVEEVVALKNTLRDEKNSDGLALSYTKLLEYERNGHLKLPNLLKNLGMDASDVYTAFENVFNARRLEAYTQKMRVFGVEEAFLSKLTDPEEARDILEEVCEEEGREIPFLQIFHLHEGTSASAAVLRTLATSRQLGKLAADLMGVKSVMLYQTCAFVKEPGHAETRWHSDLNTAPFDTNSMITFWIALTAVPTVEHAPLEFATGSHRDFALPYWYSNEGMQNLESRNYTIASHEPLASGDATAHSGWVLHASPPNTADDRRCAFSITYVNTGAKTLTKEGLRRMPDDEDMEGYRDWLARVQPGQPVTHALLPVVYPAP